MAFGALPVAFAVLLLRLVNKSLHGIANAAFNNFLSPMFHVVGSMENFINEYFVDPIWSHSGYNVVNTLTYAVIAIIAIFLIYRIIEKRVKIDANLVAAVMCFVLLGATMRVVTDSIDTGVFQAVTPVHEWILDSGIYDYGYFTVSPGIYIVVAALLLVSFSILYKLKRLELLPYVAIVLWIPNFLLLVPFMNYWIYAFPVIIMAAIPAGIAYWYFRDMILGGIVAAHAFDGAATFFAIEIFPMFTGIQYSEQHVFSEAIGVMSGNFFGFYLLKCAIAFAAAYFLAREKLDENERNYIALVLMIIGFAPGIRDVLRMIIGA